MAKSVLFLVDICVGIASVICVPISCLFMVAGRDVDLSLVANSIFFLCCFSLLLFVINFVIFCSKHYRSESMCYFRLGNFTACVFFFCYKIMLLLIMEGILMLFPTILLVIAYFLLEENYIQRMKEKDKTLNSIMNHENITCQRQVVTSSITNKDFV